MANVTLTSLTSSQIGANETSHIVDMPATVNAGDLLIILFATDGDNTIASWDAGAVTGWVELDNVSNGTQVSFSIAYLKADGTEDGSTATVTTTSGERSAHVTSAWGNTADPDTLPPEVDTAATGTDEFPDCPNTSPSWGASGTNFWIACAGADQPTNITTWAEAGNQRHQFSAGSNGCTAMMSTIELDVASYNPATPYELTEGAEQWITQTICIPSSDATPPEVTDVVKDMIMCSGIIPFAR